MITITVSSKEKTEMVDVTRQVAEKLTQSGINDGLVMLFVPHTTAGITINEGADPSVKSDIIHILNKVIPWKESYRHMEGNSPAHIKASLIGSSELVAIENGKLVLGTWQSIFFCEFDGPRQRKLQLTIIQK